MNMKQQVGGIAVVAVMMFGAAAGAGQVTPRSAPARSLSTETLTLKPGEVRELPVKEVSRVSIEDPEVVAVVVNGPREQPVLHMTGGKAGSTTLIVWSRSGTRQTYELVVKG